MLCINICMQRFREKNERVVVGVARLLISQLMPMLLLLVLIDGKEDGYPS